MARSGSVEVEAPAADGDTRSVTISNPAKVYFSTRGETKLDLVNYLLAVGEGVLRGVHLRPTVMHRYPDGAEGKSFFQKRVPDRRPDWLETATVTFPSGNSAVELCPADVAHLVWAANLGCLGFDPWPVRRWDMNHPDELRVDLDPQPGIEFSMVREVALAVNDLLGEVGLVGWPKTSGSRGIHILVRIHPNWGFDDVRRAALALARELARRMPDTVTAEWWKEDRGERVFVDYNQNARDRTVASAYSARANPEGRVSAPLRWDEVADVDPHDLTIATMPARFAQLGDLHAGIDDAPCSLAGLLELAERDLTNGLDDGPLPPFGRRE